MFICVAVHIARAAGVPLELELDPVCAVHKVHAAALQQLIRHGAQIDPETDLVIGVELLQVHVRPDDK